VRSELASLVLGSSCVLGALACGGRIGGEDEGGAGGGRSGPEHVDAATTGDGSSTANGRSPVCGPVSGEPRIIGPLKGTAGNMVADADAVY